MHALVTGCAGFIGSHLTEELLARGHSVTGVDSLRENYDPSIKRANIARAQDFDAFSFAQLDLASEDPMQLVADAEVIFHLAAEPGVRTSWGSSFASYVQNNVLATQQLLEAAKASSGTRFVFASSSSVYGQAAQLPTPEESVARPFSPYGVTKLAAEQLCLIYGQSYDLETVCLRYFSVFGPRQRPDMAFHRFCRAALERHPLVVRGDGTQSRDFTFVADVVTATVTAATAPTAAGNTYNIGAGSQVSLAEAISVLEALLGDAVQVEFVGRDRGDVAATSADITKAKADLQYSPSSVFDEALGAQLTWVGANLDLLRRVES